MSWPEAIVPAQELEPEYEPVKVDEASCASPDTWAVHAPCGASNPPAGTLIVKVTDDPETVPITDPRPVTFVAVSVMVSVPLTDAPDCVICHVICPGPDESDAVPLQVPVRLEPVGDDGAAGGEESLLLLQAESVEMSTTMAAIAHDEQRRVRPSTGSGQAVACLR